MADAVKKFLAKVSSKDRSILIGIMEKIQKGKTVGLQVKKLTGHSDIFRVRKGDFRTVYKKKENDVVIIAVERRSEATYRDF